ncbi:MAG: DUF494 domain-containing protein [Candidatus Kapabacteria bacterium]|nr:DUF494 domain-containing protein [Candidatus Kapabacteria bacterium]
MHENVIDIITYLMTELHKNHSINEKTVATLSNQGYSQAEISTAFSWLIDHTSSIQGLSNTGHTFAASLRVLHEFEKMFISTHAFGYLVLLQQLGIIDNRQMEDIIEQCIASGQQPIGLPKVKQLVAAFLFNAHSYRSDSGTVVLQPTDTIH